MIQGLISVSFSYIQTLPLSVDQQILLELSTISLHQPESIDSVTVGVHSCIVRHKNRVSPNSSYGRQAELLLLYPKLRVRKSELTLRSPSVQGGAYFRPTLGSERAILTGGVSTTA